MYVCVCTSVHVCILCLCAFVSGCLDMYVCMCGNAWLQFYLQTGLTVAPLFINVDPNWNCILTACLCVFVGCKRSVKETPPLVRIQYSLLSYSCFVCEDTLIFIASHKSLYLALCPILYAGIYSRMVIPILY